MRQSAKINITQVAAAHGMLRWGRPRTHYIELPAVAIRPQDLCARCEEPLITEPLDGGVAIPRADEIGRYEMMHYECFGLSLGSIPHLAHLCTCFRTLGLEKVPQGPPRGIAKITEAYGITHIMNPTSTEAQSLALELTAFEGDLWEHTLPIYSLIKLSPDLWHIGRDLVVIGHTLSGPAWHVHGSHEEAINLIPEGLQMTLEPDREVWF